MLGEYDLIFNKGVWSKDLLSIVADTKWTPCRRIQLYQMVSLGYNKASNLYSWKVHVICHRHFVFNPDLIDLILDVLHKLDGGALACHTALFTFWQWILPLIPLQVAKTVFIHISKRPHTSMQMSLWKSAMYSLCEGLCCVHWFFYNKCLHVVKTDFNYYSIRVHQENLIQPLSIRYSFQWASIWHHYSKWTEMNAVTKWFKTIFRMLSPGNSSGPAIKKHKLSLII